MISDEWEVRFFSKVDRLVFAQSYSPSSSFSFEEAEVLCDRICDILTNDLGNAKYYLGGKDELQGMGCKPVRAEDD